MRRSRLIPCAHDGKPRAAARGSGRRCRRADRLKATRLLRGFTVETFASGAEFLRAVQGHEPDCVVLDLHMPEMSGFDVQGALASGHAGVPVVVITGHDTPESRARALRLGAKAYLCKPVNDEALLAAIGTAIGGLSPATPRSEPC